MTQLMSRGGDDQPAYRLLPPHPPYEGDGPTAVERDADAPAPVSSPSRVRAWLGGVLAVATAALLIGLAAWALDRDDPAGAEPVAAAPTTTVATEAPDAGPVPGDALPGDLLDRLPDDLLDELPEGFFENHPEDLFRRFQSIPDDGEFFAPDGFEEFFGESPFIGPDGRFRFPDGFLSNHFGELGELLDDLQVTDIEDLLPEGAVLRGMAIDRSQAGDELAFGITATFEYDGARVRLTIGGPGDLPDGEAVDLNGTPGVVTADGDVVWATRGGALTMSVASNDLEEAGLVDLATRIEEGLR